MDKRILKCIQCGNDFSISGEEMEKLYSRGFAIPKRCPDCRRNKSKISDGNSSEWRRKGKKRGKKGKESYWEEKD